MRASEVRPIQGLGFIGPYRVVSDGSGQIVDGLKSAFALDFSGRSNRLVPGTPLAKVGCPEAPACVHCRAVRRDSRLATKSARPFS